MHAALSSEYWGLPSLQYAALCLSSKSYDFAGVLGERECLSPAGKGSLSVVLSLLHLRMAFHTARVP